MTRLVPSDVLMCYDGSLEGFFSVVFQAYARHVVPSAIAETENAQLSFCQSVIDVETDMTLAERVKVGLCNRVGFGVFKKVQRAFASCEPGREMLLFRYIVAVMEKGKRAAADLSDPTVNDVEKLALRVANEMEDMRQFVRFRMLENGGYVSVINPRADLVPLIMGYFVERYNTQPFVIYDEVHHVAGVYDMRKSYFIKSEAFDLPAEALGEKQYQRLWKTFYDSLSNEQRFNPDLRRGMMPKRFWRNLTEMTMAVPSASNMAG